MNITKFGHSCVLLDSGNTKLLFDPGLYGGIPSLSVDAIVITHVHQDHLDMDQLRPLLAQGQPRIITNSEVKAELDKHGIACEVVEHGTAAEVGDFTLEAFGTEHAIMHPDLPKFQNTGYLINGQIFHPGDALYLPSKPVEILLLPVAAPWSKVSETLDYITAVKAKFNFPIHDGFITDGGAFHRFANMWCEKLGTQFVKLELGQPYELSF